MRVVFVSFILLSAAFALCVTASAQSDASTSGPTPFSRRQPSKALKEMLSRQEVERQRKEYVELLAKGEQAAALSRQLETAYAQNGTLSKADRERLKTLESLVTKIRKDLGGDEEADALAAKDNPLTPAEGVKSLQTRTSALLDELKKMTRFSISAAAIKTSSSVLHIVRFLKVLK